MSTRYGNSKPSKRVPEQTEQNGQRDWVGMRAVAWVIDEAPVPADLAFTLAVIARRADANGKGSYQSAATIAEKTGLSEKQARRNVLRLLKLRLIKPGDQSLVDGLPVGRRPTVYDLVMDRVGPKPANEPRNKAGVNRKATPPMDGTPPFQGTPPMGGGSTPPFDGDPTPPMESPSTPPMDGRQRTLRRNQVNNPVEESLSRTTNRRPETRTPEEPEREPDQAKEPADQPDPYATQRRYLTPLIKKYPQHTDRDWVDRFIRTIEASHKVGNRGWWRTVAANGDLANVVEELHYLVDTITPAKPRHPWCGKCDQHTRKRLDEDGYGGGVVMRPCPRCSDKAELEPAGKKPGHTPYPEGPVDLAKYEEPHPSGSWI